MVTLEPIVLGESSKKKKQNIFSRALDIVSAPLSQPGTTFSKGLSAGADKVRKSRAKISSGDKFEALKVVGKTLLSTGLAAGVVLGGGTAAGRTALAQAGKGVAGAAAKKPLLTLAGVGLASTKGGRDLLKTVPQKAFEGGRIAGKVLGGEETGLSGVGKAAAAGGLLGAAAVAGKLLKDKLTRDKAVEVLPSLNQLGRAEPEPPKILEKFGNPQQELTGSSTPQPVKVGENSAVRGPLIVQVNI